MEQVSKSSYYLQYSIWDETQFYSADKKELNCISKRDSKTKIV